MSFYPRRTPESFPLSEECAVLEVAVHLGDETPENLLGYVSLSFGARGFRGVRGIRGWLDRAGEPLDDTPKNRRAVAANLFVQRILRPIIAREIEKREGWNP